MSDVLPEKQLMGRRWKLSRGIHLLNGFNKTHVFLSNYYIYILEIYKDCKRIYLSIIPIH